MANYLKKEYYLTINDFLDSEWFQEVLEEFEDEKENLIEELTAYLEFEDTTYEQAMNYVFFYLKSVYE